MILFDHHATGEIILRVHWESTGCWHEENFHCHPVNLWRDILPAQLIEQIMGSREGDQLRVQLPHPPFEYRPELIRTFPADRWQGWQQDGTPTKPRLGRWYPQGYAAGLPGIFATSALPMRVVGLERSRITVDCNHPLAGRRLELGATIGPLSAKGKERGGRCASWLLEATAQGPGMQALFTDLRPDFLEPDALQRQDEQSDTHFYRAPRLVGHIDNQASSLLQDLLGRMLSPGAALLDLMASYQSHLPAGFAGKVTGLGLNDQEMRENKAIDESIVHDLNHQPELPFANESFDGVLCNLSFEYLLQPQEVIQEILRILKRGGLLVISVSDRWFPPKVTRLWTRLHPFERVGYILHHLRDSFTDLTTHSYRGWPRPADDPHPLPESDPLFVISASKPKEQRP